MPYISASDVKTIRTKLKKLLPTFKLSVTTVHHSTVKVRIISGPVDFGGSDIGVNEYHIERDWADKPTAKLVLEVISGAIAETRKVDYHEDSDYGSVPSYYVSIRIGSYDKPYLIKA